MSRPSDPPSVVCDPGRLAALEAHAVLDTLPEQGFDDVVRLASRLCDTPVALVSLVAGTRQWFKARTGFPLAQTDLGRSVCAHALTQPDSLLVIPDLTQDPRTRDNPLVTASPGIRFYAGAPLRTPEGHVLGTLCVIDYVSRPEGLSATEADDLRALARQVTGHLAMRRAAAEREAALRAVQATEERYRLAARATNDAIWDWDFATDHVLWNEALQAAYGHPLAEVAPTGAWWIDHIHPDDRARIDASIHAVIDGAGTVWSDEYRFRRADGSYADVLDRGSVIRDAAGRAIRMIGAMLDLTERRRAEAARRDSERRLDLERSLLKSVFRQAPVGISVAGTEPGAPNLINARAEAILGHSLGGPALTRYQSFRAEHADGRIYAPDDYPSLRALREGAVVTGEAMRYRNAATGALRLLEVSSAPVRDEDGTIRAAVTVFLDVTEQRRAEAQLRRLALVAEQSSDFIAIADADGIIDYVNPAGRALVGLSEDAARGAHLTDVFAPEDLPFAEGTILPAIRAGGSWSGEYRLRHLASGAVVPVRYNLFALRGPGGGFEGFAAVSHDISARKAAEARQEILNRELSHRLKNTLAMVQAVAVQTLRNATDPAAARDALVARLVALGKAHDILLTGEGESADLRAVLEGALAIHDDGRPGRFRLQGPPVPCGARAALSLTLMAHELATNAVKYGALRHPDGYVTLDWAVAGRAGPVLSLRWQEHGGPPVTPPARKGFGSRLIERGLAGTVDGEVATHYPPEGVVCTLTAPLAELLTGE
ncbi:PAS domain S-box protein [Methylobacterium terricola]|uniref:Blue-light-activated histidine kinase n=1 Tax=Methylobacterium terricola TaxID=2583531 RepID=A0A5C4LS14_9HYPH|nr:PAS domain S-box protein [Methylobacterium terricola]TNC15807.1 PAS domain S-box protein [Methylobacterium terricola]